jgi:hypothetical protein
MNKLLTTVVLLVVVSVIVPLTAHHGRGSTYDMNKRVTLKGVVSRVDWRNPHVVIYMDVKDDGGKVVMWGFENAGVSQPTAIVVKVVLADGSEVMSRESGANPVN